ncbi:MAG: hypothetical protein WB785_21220 [Mycobacterium sp.]|uniref:GHMP family kinase ATP-binding protein n=1 Tax=Mycobacterium sp. TaxID=1785 RepID=UPI003C672976
MPKNNRPAKGVGSSSAHHGEILQGVFRDNKDRLTRALVTLQCSDWKSHATFYPSSRRADIICTPGMWKARRAAVVSMTEFSTNGSPVTGGYLDIRSDIPCGIGMGSSTADVTAAIRAIAVFHGVAPTPEEIGRIAVEVECASDPIMIDDRVVLFAHREGTVLETLGRHLPPMIVVGCDAEPGTGTIDTLALPPAAYSATDIDAFGFLRAELRAAVVNGDTARLGQVATSSALINQQFLPKSALDFLLDLCERVGGCGIQVAHSGTVAGVIFDSRRDDLRQNIDRCVSGIDKAGLSLTGIIACSQDDRRGRWILSLNESGSPGLVTVCPGASF